MRAEDQENTSLRDDLVAAFKDSTNSEPDTSGAEPAGGNKDTPIHSSEQTVDAKPEGGKPVAAAAQAATPGQAKAETPVEPPARWTKEEKEQFAALDPGVQRILLGRNKGLEADYTRKMTEIAQERQRFHGIEQVLSPRREMWTRQGMNDAQFLNSVMSYWDAAQRDPVSFIDSFARERGIDLASYFMPSAEQLAAYFGNAQAEGSPDGQQGAIHPAVSAQLQAIARQQQELQQAVQQTQQFAVQQMTQQQAAIKQAASTELQQFVSETDEHGQPLRPFLEDVRPDMVKLMQNGMADTLQEAYDKAIYMRADVRAKIEENKEITRRRTDEQRRQEEAAKARRAGSSVSGSPSVYSPSPSGDDEEGLSIRQLIEKQFARANTGSRI